MVLAFSIWLILIGLLWAAEAFPPGSHGDFFHPREHGKHPVGVTGNLPSGDEILDINKELIPPEAPGSSFLIEGDIVKVSPFRLFSSASPKWPKRRGTVQIPYIISYKYDKPSVKIIKEAFADFAKFTCIKFIPYSYQRDFISIMPMSGCFSSVGRTGGMQVVSLAPPCLKRGKGVALHELMHVVGFWHEHSRADRDKFISIAWNEILTGFEINFMKSWTSNMLVNYDYSSVLHYGRYAFSMTGLPTIIPLSNPNAALGQRWNLSSSDIARVNKLYKCSLTGMESVGFSGSTTKKKVMDFIPKQLEPCPTEGEIKVSTPSPTAGTISSGTNTPETAQCVREPSKKTGPFRADMEEHIGRTAMDEGLKVPLTPGWSFESVTLEPTELPNCTKAYLEATKKSPPFPMEMRTIEVEGQSLIPTEDSLLLAAESIKEPDFTSVMTSLKSQIRNHEQAAEGLSTITMPTKTLAGLELELVSARVTPTEVREIVETTSIQGMAMTDLPTYWTQKGLSLATEVGGGALSLEQASFLETQAEMATERSTSSLEMSGIYKAAFLSLGLTPHDQVSATETFHPTSTEKWTTRLASSPAITSMAPPRTGVPKVGADPSPFQETIAVTHAPEQTSLVSPIQNRASSLTKRNQPASGQTHIPGSNEQSIIAMLVRRNTETEPTDVMQPTTVMSSLEVAENHITYLVKTGLQEGAARHKGTSLHSSGIETSYKVPPTKSTTSMKTQMELKFIEATKIQDRGKHGSPGLTECTQSEDAEHTIDAVTLPVAYVSQSSELVETGIQATPTNYKMRTNPLFPVGRTSPTAVRPAIPSLLVSQKPPMHPYNAGPAEATRSEARSKTTFSSRRPTKMEVQADSPSANRKGGQTCTPNSVLSSTVTELKPKEHTSLEASGLETSVAHESHPSEMEVIGDAPAWTEAENLFNSSGTREATFFPCGTEKGYSTQVLQSSDFHSLPEGIQEYGVGYRMGARLVIPTSPQAGVKRVVVSLETTPTKIAYPAEGPTLLQPSSSIEPRLEIGSKQPMHANMSVKESLALPQVTPTTFTLAEELQHHSTQTLGTLASLGPQRRPVEAEERGKTFLLPMRGALPAEDETYMSSFATGLSESQTTNAAELQTKASLAKQHLTPHAERVGFPTANPSEAVNTSLMGTSETLTTPAGVTSKPRAQVGSRKQMMGWFPKAFRVQMPSIPTTSLTEEATGLAREGRSREILTPAGMLAVATKSLWEPPKIIFTTARPQTQGLSPTELALITVPICQRKACSRTEQTEETNLPVTEGVLRQFLESLTKTAPQSVLDHQEVQKPWRKQGVVHASKAKTNVTHVEPPLNTAAAPITNSSTKMANTIGSIFEMGISAYVFSTSTETKGQGATGFHRQEEHYIFLPASIWPISRDSQHPGHLAKESSDWEMQPENPYTQNPTQTPSNTKTGTSTANTSTDAVHSTREVMVLETSENQAVMAIKETSYKEGSVTTTQALASETLSNKTTGQVPSTQVHKTVLQRQPLISPSEQGTSKPTTNITATREGNTHINSTNGVSYTGLALASRHLAEGVSQLQHSTEMVSPIELHSRIQAMMLHREEHSKSSFPPERVEAVVKLSTHSPEPSAQRLEEVSNVYQKKGGKPSPVCLRTMQPFENETDLPSTTLVEDAVGVLEAQNELGVTKISVLNVLDSSPLAERLSFRRTEAKRAMNSSPSNSTETWTKLPRAVSAGLKAPEQPCSPTWGIRMKTAKALSSSERRGHKVRSDYTKKNRGQAPTQPPIGSMFSAGSDMTYVHPSLWSPSHQKVLGATETQMESVHQPIVEGIPSQYLTSSSLDSQTTIPSVGSNRRRYKLSAPGYPWGLGGEMSAILWHTNLVEQWANSTKPTSGELSTPQSQMHKARTTINSATPGSEESLKIKMTQLQWPLQKPPRSLSVVDSELLHLVDKRSLPEMRERPAPPHGSNPNHTAISLSHEHFVPLIPNTLEKLQAKVLEALQRQRFMSPEFQRSPATGLCPPARRIRLEAGTSSQKQNEKCGELCLSTSPFLGRKRPCNCCLNCFDRSPHAATDKLSGIGKHAQPILPTQRTVVPPGLLNWQVCDFKSDLCGWQQSNTDDFDWLLVGERPAGPVIGNTPRGRTLGFRGSYISLKSPFSRQTPEQKAALISPILQRLGCIHFWYSPLGSVMGTISIYLKAADAPEWHRIWSAKGQQGTSWHEVNVEASVSQKLQVMVEGVIGLEAGSDAAIDDLGLCMIEC